MQSNSRKARRALQRAARKEAVHRLAVSSSVRNAEVEAKAAAYDAMCEANAKRLADGIKRIVRQGFGV